MQVKELKLGDPCPRCEGAFKKARVPTDAEFAKAFDKENPTVLREGSDTANPEQRAELGALYRCADCGLQHRFHDQPAAAAQPTGN